MAEYLPEWGDASVFTKYTRVFIARNHWRVAYLMTSEDALQCGAEVFARCLRYCTARGGKVDNPKWFMSLYKLALLNEFNTLSLRCRRTYEADAQWGAQQSEHANDVDFNHGPVAVILSECSMELKQVLLVVAKAPSELLSMLLESADEANWSRRLCRLCGVHKVNDALLAELRDRLSSQ